MINLFPDQQALEDEVRASMAHHKRVLLQAATGSGKTVLGASMIAKSRAKGTRSIFMVPRRELLKQSSESFAGYGIPHSYIAAGRDYNDHAKTFLATTGTLISRIRKGTAPDVNVLFVDEAHYGGAGLDEVISYYAGRRAWVIGLSATPERLDGRGLDKHYTHMICGPSIGQLIADKRLSDYRLFAPNRPNLAGIKTVAGDFAKAELAARMEEDRVLIGNAVNHYKQHAMGKLNIAYCTSIKHSNQTVEAFRAQGIPAAHVDGNTSDDDMRQIIKAFARREILTLCNCDLLTFGFDLSSASGGMDVTVESMSDLKPTKSLALQMQKWGRVLRFKKFPAMVFDHAGNAMHANGTPHHGLPDDERDWLLTGRVKREGAGKGIAIKQCENCFFCYHPAPVCPNCGHTPVIMSRMVEEVEGELSEVVRAPRKILTPEERATRRELIEKLMKNAKGRGVPAARAMDWAVKKADEQLGRL